VESQQGVWLPLGGRWHCGFISGSFWGKGGGNPGKAANAADSRRERPQNDRGEN
jgi:hypothetical protein